LFLWAGSPSHAADLFRELVKAHRHYAEGYAGLAEAEFEMGDYASAASAASNALRLDPEDAATRKRLETAQAILAIDPTLRRLGTAERFRRSQRLLQAAPASVKPSDF